MCVKAILKINTIPPDYLKIALNRLRMQNKHLNNPL